MYIYNVCICICTVYVYICLCAYDLSVYVVYIHAFMDMYRMYVCTLSTCLEQVQEDFKYMYTVHVCMVVCTMCKRLLYTYIQFLYILS